MNSQRDSQGQDTTPLAMFLERIRRSFSHDMRTPLGTIVNYAAVLEANSEVDPEEVRDLGRRIRGNALRVSRMLQMLATATGLAARPLSSADTDMAALARSILVDAGGRGHVQLVQGTARSLVHLDAELVGFAWRAYVSVENDARETPVDDVDLLCESAAEHVSVEIRCGGRVFDTHPTDGLSAIELPRFLSYDNGPARAECAMRLGLACDLISSHKGELRLWGKPGSSSVVRVRLPATI